ncbi:hypothetical protein B0H13DRAFT_2348106 [Mycena leptocephala]|nr:hypothetical protein B0H13DRAFT_2348106 [Mycena leptocephala]
MLTLQTVTIALTLSYFSYASPLSSGGDDSTEIANVVRDLAAAAARTYEYVPGPMETSLTRRYYQERATCVDQFVWYCTALAGLCIAAIPGLATPLAILSCLPCIMTAACVGITVLIGVLCCNGIIKNCDQANSASIESAMNQLNDMPLDIQSMLNGWKLDAPFTKETFQPVFFDQVAANQGDHANLTNAEFDTMWTGFIGRISNNATKPPSSIDIDMFNNYLKGKNTTVPIIG